MLIYPFFCKKSFYIFTKTVIADVLIGSRPFLKVSAFTKENAGVKDHENRLFPEVYYFSGNV